MSISNLEFQWIDNTEQLKQLTKEWHTAAFLCVDTEFHREKTFYPQLALLQLNHDGNNYLIEPSVAVQVPEFIELFENPRVTKVFHSASEDCEVLFRAFKTNIEPLFDTQIAAAYLGERNGIGYAALVNEVTGEELAKGQTRSDWMVRPLSSEQEFYAAADVHFLHQIFLHQKEQLENNPSLKNWVLEDSNAMAQRVDDLDNVADAYLEIKNAWKLNQKQLVRLNELCQWREITARKLDQPKPFVLRNEVLFELAQKGLVDDSASVQGPASEEPSIDNQSPDNRSSESRYSEQNSKNRLPFIKGWHPASLRRHGSALQSLLEELNYDQADLVKPLSPEFWQKHTSKMQQIKASIEQVAEQLGIPADVICSRKLQRQYVSYLLNSQKSKPRAWTKSREQHIGPVIKSALA